MFNLKNFSSLSEQSDYGINLFRANSNLSRLEALAAFEAAIKIVAELGLTADSESLTRFVRVKGIKVSRKARIGMFNQMIAKGFIR